MRNCPIITQKLKSGNALPGLEAGMLEHQTLSIRCKLLLGHRPTAITSNRAPDSPCWSITDSTTGQPFGFAYLRPRKACCGFWFLPTIFRVHEADDEPLLFTAKRSRFWKNHWQVLDADGYRVGTLRRNKIYAP